MANSIPIVIIVIAVVLVILALLVWRRQKEEKPERISSTQKKAFFVQFIIGIAIALMAAIFSLMAISWEKTPQVFPQS